VHLRVEPQVEAWAALRAVQRRLALLPKLLAGCGELASKFLDARFRDEQRVLELRAVDECAERGRVRESAGREAGGWGKRAAGREQ
jgi:hypothetical protein